MARWGDIATWRGPTPNQGPRMIAHDGVVLHIAEGFFAGTQSWLKNPASRTSAHFVVSKEGEIVQLVDTDTQSWCQQDGNARWLSVENAGWAGELLTEAQVSACARILAKAHQVYGVPLVATNDPDGSGLGWHGMGAPDWGHSGCPGAPIVAQRAAIITEARRIAGLGSAAGEEEDDVKIALMQYQEPGSGAPEPTVYVTVEGLVSWPLGSLGEIADRRWLGNKGVFSPLPEDITVVGRRSLLGKVLDRPEGLDPEELG